MVFSFSSWSLRPRSYGWPPYWFLAGHAAPKSPAPSRRPGCLVPIRPESRVPAEEGVKTSLLPLCIEPGLQKSQG
jgi:hypothetical protein